MENKDKPQSQIVTFDDLAKYTEEVVSPLINENLTQFAEEVLLPSVEEMIGDLRSSMEHGFAMVDERFADIQVELSDIKSEISSIK